MRVAFLGEYLPSAVAPQRLEGDVALKCGMCGERALYWLDLPLGRVRGAEAIERLVMLALPTEL